MRDQLETAHVAFFAHFRDRLDWLAAETHALSHAVSRPPLSSANGGYARSHLEREVSSTVGELEQRTRRLREQVCVAPASTMLAQAQALFERNEYALETVEDALEPYGYVRPVRAPTPPRARAAPAPPAEPAPEPELPPSPAWEGKAAGGGAPEPMPPTPGATPSRGWQPARGGYSHAAERHAAEPPGPPRPACQPSTVAMAQPHADENLPPSPGLSLESLGLSEHSLRVVAASEHARARGSGGGAAKPSPQHLPDLLGSPLPPAARASPGASSPHASSHGSAVRRGAPSSRCSSNLIASPPQPQPAHLAAQQPFFSRPTSASASRAAHPALGGRPRTAAVDGCSPRSLPFAPAPSPRGAQQAQPLSASAARAFVSPRSAARAGNSRLPVRSTPRAGPSPHATAAVGARTSPAASAPRSTRAAAPEPSSADVRLDEQLPGTPPSLSPLRTTTALAHAPPAAAPMAAGAAAALCGAFHGSCGPPSHAQATVGLGGPSSGAVGALACLAASGFAGSALAPISPAEYGHAPSFLRSQFEFLQLNAHVAQIGAAVGARLASACGEPAELWTSEAIALATGLAPLSGDTGASELNVKALLLFLTHTGRALAERQGTLTCYRLALQQRA